MTQLFGMSGYGCYIWPAYGITLVVFFINLCLGLQEKKRIQKTIRLISQYQQNEY